MRVFVPLFERQHGEPGPPGRDGDGQRGEVDECFGTCAGRVQREEGRVAQPEERREFRPDERGGIERVADDFCQRPREHHAGVERATLGLFFFFGTQQKNDK